jgi:beta-N-acetylhexosaminidase
MAGSAATNNAKTAPPAATPTDPTGGTDIDALLAGMSLEERAGQLIMAPVEAGSGTASVVQAIKERHVGAVLLLGPNWRGADSVSTATEAFRAARSGPVGLWIAADQEGGQVQRLVGQDFETIPPALEQGRLEVADLERQAASWGAQLANVGVNLNLAPVVDTVDSADRASNAPIGALERDFGLDAAGNAAHAKAFAAGMAAAGVGSALKHFPGLGRVTGNTDYAAAGITDTVTTASDPAVQAFAEAIEGRPTMVMVALATYSQLDAAAPAAFSQAVVTDLLRGQLGWDGVVISDSLTAEAVSGVAARDRAVRFIEAGGDLACFGGVADALTALDGVLSRAASDPDFAALVDAAARRVLTAKAAAGLV